MIDRSPVLDLIRIFAALSVMCFHLAYWIWIPAMGDASALLETAAATVHAPDPSLAWGWIGVQVFFTLSGFLIAGAASADWTDFARSRVRRLLPGALACASITTLMAWSAAALPADWLARFAASATLWPFGPWVDDVYWTLGMELGFYAVAGALLAAGKGDRLEAVMVCLAGVSVAAWMTSLIHGGYEPALAGVDQRITQILLLKDAPFFAAGVILRRGLDEGWNSTRTACLGLVAVSACAPVMAESLVRGASAGVDPNPMLPALIWIGGLVAIGTLSRRGRSGRTLTFLSRATYPLYLVHNVAGTAVIVHADRLGAGKHASVVAAMVLSVAAALVVTRYVEPALLRLFRLDRARHVATAEKGSNPVEEAIGR